MTKYLLAAVCSGLFLTGTVRTSLTAQVRYARGQDVSPTFDGWEQNSDGTYSLHFGYFNRNSEEELDVLIGPENNVDPGGDRGQPTHFYTARKWWVFKVTVPKDWPKEQRVVWTLTTHGKTSQAKGWLQPEWEVDYGVISKNAARDPFLMTTNSGDADHENRPPSITGSSAQTIALSDTLTLIATATDDGRPKPLVDAAAGQQGVRVRWILYRGPGRVRFDPDIMSQRVYGKPATLETKVTFSVPGTYRLRAIANDGQLFSTYDVDVTVRR
ncbi:MAG: hypothetical protein DMG13_19890 [Acidobacteria bacterium]|nr:MAG: hypothetical protein DMG13_19890 [Acidobacteriota bacterium]